MIKLRTALMAVVQEVCEILGSKKMPMRNWTRIKRMGEGQIVFTIELRPDVTNLIGEFFRIKGELTSLKQLLEVIDANHKLSSVIFCDIAGQPILNNDAKETWIVNFFVQPFLFEYFSKLETIYFDCKAARTSIDNLITKLETPVSRFISVTPLLNLKLTMDVLEVVPGLKLRMLTANELEKWINSSSIISAHPISSMDLFNLQYAVEITDEACPDKNQSRLLLNNLVDLLRLVTNSKIYIAFIEEELQDANSPLLCQSSQSWGYSLRLLDSGAIIDDAAGSRLVNLWRCMQQSPNTDRIELAFKRWSETVERLFVEDKLIDYWIALESLFASDSSQEVKFRASLRIASFLGETPEKRMGIYNDMRSSYDWRSAIVHGEFRKPNKIKELNKKCTLHDITEKTRSYLRESLLQLLESNKKFDPTNIELMLLGK